MRDQIKASISDSINLKQQLLEDEEAITQIEGMVKAICESYRNGGKVLIMGNGGSAADAQHIVAELVGRFMMERKALPAIALTTNSSNMTSIANDYDFDSVFSRQVEAFGNAGDIIIGITTSGNSKNIEKALIKAKEQGMTTIGFLGKTGGVCKELCDYVLCPNSITARIQEVHIMVGHILCELIEKGLFEE